MLKAQCTLFGEHCEHVNSEVAAPDTRLTTFFSRATVEAASAMAEIAEVNERIDLVDIDPSAGDAGGEVGFILVVGGDDVDRPSFLQEPGVLDSHLCRNDTSDAADVGCNARLVAQASNPYDLVHLGGIRGTGRRH